VGSAKASNGTVTITGGSVEVKQRLVVPEGVTLNLTAKDAVLELRDGTVLKVNGTTNATGHGDHDKSWGSIHTYYDGRLPALYKLLVPK
jgi:hypothetical protein